MAEKLITIGKLLDEGLIKRETKVRVVSITQLKKAGLIKTIKLKKPILIAPKELVTVNLLKERGLIKR